MWATTLGSVNTSSDSVSILCNSVSNVYCNSTLIRDHTLKQFLQTHVCIHVDRLPNWQWNWYRIMEAHLGLHLLHSYVNKSILIHYLVKLRTLWGGAYAVNATTNNEQCMNLRPSTSCNVGMELTGWSRHTRVSHIHTLDSSSTLCAQHERWL